MELNRSPTGTGQDFPASPSADALYAVGNSLDTVQVGSLAPSPAEEQVVLPKHRRSWWRWAALGLGVCAVVVGGLVAILHKGSTSPQLQSGTFNVVTIPLSDIKPSTQAPQPAQSLQVNGELQVAGPLLLTPGSQPAQPRLGQLYYDKAANHLSYYDGQGFVAVGGGNTSVTNVTNVSNITNILGGGAPTGVLLQATSPGTQQTGNFNVSGNGTLGTLQTAAIVSSGQLSVRSDGLTVQNAASHQTLQIASNGAATFSNQTDTTAAFKVQNAASQNVLTVDTTDNLLVLGNDGTAANVSVTGVRGGAVSGNNLTGKNLVISAGNGTGTGGSGDIVFNTATGVSNPLVTLDTTGGNEGNSTTLTWAHNTGVHPDEVLIVAANAQASSSPATVTSVTYNGIPLTLLTNLSGSEDVGSVWYLVNPPTGSHTVSVTYSGGNILGTGGASTTFYNVDQGNPIGAFNTQSVGFGTSVNTTLSGTNAGQVVFDALLSRQSLGIVNPSTGQTLLYRELSNNVNAASYRTGTSGSTTMSWSGTGVGANINHIVLSLNPEPNVTPDPLTEAVRITQSSTVGIALSSTESAQASLTLGGSADRSIIVNQNPATGAGHNLTIQAGGGAVGSNNGGDLLLQGGFGTGTGTAGSVTVRPPSDTTAAFRVQNAASSTTVLSVDTTSNVVAVSALVSAGSITVNGHIITGGTTPGIAAGAAACTTPTVSVSGNDTSGIITITTGTGCAASGTLATLTFAAAFGAAPHVMLTPGSATALTLGAYVNDATLATTSFAIGTNTTPVNSTTYKWNYMVLQ